MVKTTVYLDEADAQFLRAMSERLVTPQAELIRQAIHSFTQKEAVPLPKGLGAFASGRKDTAARSKEILREAARAGRWR